MVFKIEKIDTGRCNIVYKTLNVNNEEIYYCLLQDLNGIELYRCSIPFKEYGEYIYEPQSKCSVKSLTEFQIPTGNTNLEKQCREYILSHNLMRGF